MTHRTALALVRNPGESIEHTPDGGVTIIKNYHQAPPDELRPLTHWLATFELPEATVRGWIRRGVLPAIEAKRGGTLVRRSDLLAVVDKLSRLPKVAADDPAAAHAALVAQARRGGR